MKRIGVYVYYDKAGIVDTYIEVLLEELSKELDEICIIVNGEIKEEELNKFYAYTDNVHIRENIGYDAGAYRDFFLELVTTRKIAEFDEIVFMNDTFYGPLYPIKELFDKFATQQVDFWGITRHPEGSFSNGRRLSSHIQTYFFVVRKKLFTTKLFVKFWENLSYPLTYTEAIENFEIRFTDYFERNGYIGKAYMDIASPIVNFTKGKNPYICNSYELIKDLKVPFFKKKALAIGGCFSNAIKALKYIDDSLEYDAQWIVQNLCRIGKLSLTNVYYDFIEMKVFCEKYDQIYIYGAGVIGNWVKEYLEYQNQNVAGFIVTKKENDLDNHYQYDRMTIDRNTGIIVAMKKEYADEVTCVLQEKLNKEQILLPIFEN